MTVLDPPIPTSVKVPGCRTCNVKICGNPHNSLPSKGKDVPVLASESGNYYEIGQLIRQTRQGRVHRVYRLTRTAAGDAFVRSPVRLAVKIYNKQVMLAMANAKSEENPVNEMIVLSLLNQGPAGGHPNVLRVIELFTDPSAFYMIMPYLGSDVLDILEHNGPLSAQQARHLFRDVLAGLSYLHAHNIAHRDLSLENILYDEESGHYVLIDLGMCMHVPTSQGVVPCRAICGKKNYIAPEVWARTQTFNPMLADIWAAGVILFMVLVASAPMEQATPGDPHYMAIISNRLDDVLRACFPDEEESVMSMDKELLLAMDVVQKVLQRDPKQRLTIPQMLSHPFMAMPPTPKASSSASRKMLFD